MTAPYEWPTREAGQLSVGIHCVGDPATGEKVILAFRNMAPDKQIEAITSGCMIIGTVLMQLPICDETELLLDWACGFFERHPDAQATMRALNPKMPWEAVE